MCPPKKISIDDMTLAFLEHGSIRKIIEMEYELALEQFIRERDMTLKALEERELHDHIIPVAFEFLAEKRGAFKCFGGEYALAPSAGESLRKEVYREIELRLGTQQKRESMQGTIAGLLLPQVPVPEYVRDCPYS